MQNFKEEINKRVQYIEKLLASELPEIEGLQRKIKEAMKYSLIAGGKRVRPILMMETFYLFGGNEEKVIRPFMAAIEMIHTYSLVHDDLPAMDDDDMRRGRKTTHIEYGEAMGILTGDALLNYAFETACKAFDETKDFIPVAKAMQVLTRKAGVFGMIGGQVVDIEMGGNVASIEALHFIYQLKTGALLEASMMIGAILAKATDKEVETIEKVANKIGLAFQIQDDILDVISTDEVLGKPVHSDKKNKKTTYVTLIGLKQAKESVSTYSNAAMAMLKALPYENEFLSELIKQLITREK